MTDTLGQVRLYEATEQGSVVPVLVPPTKTAPMSSMSTHPLDRLYSLEAEGAAMHGGKKCPEPALTDETNKNTINNTVSLTADAAGQKTYQNAYSYSYSSNKPTVKQARGQLLILTGAILTGLGVVACSIYGFTTIRSGVVTDGVGVVTDSGRGYVEDVLRTVQGAIDVGLELDVTVTNIENQLQSGGLTSAVVNFVDTQNSVQAAIDDIQRDLRVLLEDAQDAVDTAERDVIGAIDDAIATYEPPVQRYNSYRAAGMYVLYALAIVFAVAVMTMALVRWPFLHSLSFFLLMVLMVLTSAVMVAHTGGIVVADDTCDNLERYVVDEIVDDGTRSSTTSRVLEYYVNVGMASPGYSPPYSDVYDVVQDAFGVDVRDVEKTVEDVKTAVREAIAGSGVQGLVVGALLQEEVDTATAQADEIVRLLRAAVDMLRPEVVMNGPYAEVRGFFCCSTVDDLGEMWLALTLTMSFGFVFTLFALGVTRLLDALHVGRWWKRYRYAPPLSSGQSA